MLTIGRAGLELPTIYELGRGEHNSPKEAHLSPKPSTESNLMTSVRCLS